MDCKDREQYKYLTNQNGNPQSNDDNSLTIGDRGPVLLEDTWLINKLQSFNRERMPERIVHATGAGAFGYFKLENCMRKYTKARLFTEVGETISVAARFSTVIGARGSAETARDPRGFAVKFYSKDGNYDIVGNHIPVFFIRDAIKFPDMVHAFKPCPVSNIKSPNRFWDFIASSPESMHMIMFLYSDLGTVKSFRHIEGFGVNTFIWINNEGERHYVKYHWKPKEGLQTIDRHQAEMLAGSDPTVATRDLFTTLRSGKIVEWDLYVQLMKASEERKLQFDPLDATKIWPEDRFPLMKVGKMVLDRAPENFFTEVEQLAFAPSNMIPGVEPSNDKMLQGRLFAYPDAQRHRIGPNFLELKVNRPNLKPNNNIQDGNMNSEYKKGLVNYKPNGIDNNKPDVKKDTECKIIYEEGLKERTTIHNEDNYHQAREKYNSYTKTQRDHLIDNIVSEFITMDMEIVNRVLKEFDKVSKDLAGRIKREMKEYKKV